MPSFDVVCEIDLHEVSNAVDQTNREVSNRFDFKGSSARVEQKEAELTLHADNEFQLNQVKDILHTKLAKRQVDIQALEEGKLEVNISAARQVLTVRQGIDTDTARKLVKQVKESKIKVQASIQGEKVRITGKKRDDLQQVIALLRQADVGLPLEFNNFRD
jgi:cyclic-di-GMP-binding protein